jgi:DNA end-binding protein Ku
VATTLRYPYEVRDTKEYFDEIPDVKIAPDMLKLAEHILETKKGDFEPMQFVDHYEEAVAEMLKQKQAGIAVSKGRAAEPSRNVINLMDALKRSIAQEKRSAVSTAKARAAVFVTSNCVSAEAHAGETDNIWAIITLTHRRGRG